MLKLTTPLDAIRIRDFLIDLRRLSNHYALDGVIKGVLVTPSILYILTTCDLFENHFSPYYTIDDLKSGYVGKFNGMGIFCKLDNNFPEVNKDLYHASIEVE